MAQEKEVLYGIVTLAMTGKEADGVLEQGEKVKITGPLEVGKLTAANDPVFGYLTKGNREAGDDVVVATRGKRVTSELSAEAFTAGQEINFNADGKVVKAASSRASATITVNDFSWNGGETITVNGTVLTEGTDFTAATSTAATALSIANAVNAKVPGISAKVAGAVVTLQALDAGIAGNAFTLATNDAGNSDVSVSAATFSGGKETYAAGIALETATAADQTKKILWY